MSDLSRLELRIPPDVTAIIDRLAEPHSTSLAGRGGGKTAGVIEAVRVFIAAAADAYEANIADFAAEDWALLAHSIPDADPAALYEAAESYLTDWSQVIASELSDMHEGRALVLQSHKDEQAAAKKLAKRIAKIGPMRGWAMMDALRRFWQDKDAPETWWEWRHASTA